MVGSESLPKKPEIGRKAKTITGGKSSYHIVKKVENYFNYLPSDSNLSIQQV